MLQRRRLQRCAPDRRCRKLQRHAVDKHWKAGRACAGGVKPSGAAPSGLSTKSSEARRRVHGRDRTATAGRGWPKDRILRVPLRAVRLHSGTASRAPVIRRPKMMRCTTTNSLYESEWGDSQPFGRFRFRFRFRWAIGKNPTRSRCAPLHLATGSAGEFCCLPADLHEMRKRNVRVSNQRGK